MNRLFFIIVILFSIFYFPPVLVKAAFEDSVSPEEVGQFVVQEREKNEAEFQQYLEEQKKEKPIIENKTVEISTETPKEVKSKPNTAKTVIIFLVLCASIVGLFFVFTRSTNYRG